jgi:hypothetical protein
MRRGFVPLKGWIEHVEKSDFGCGVAWFWIECLGGEPTCEANRFGFTCNHSRHKQNQKRLKQNKKYNEKAPSRLEWGFSKSKHI